MPKHIGIVGVTAEGAALCYRTICQEGPTFLGEHAHPEVTMHTFSFADYMPLIDNGNWETIGRLMLRSAEKLKGAGAAFAICPDNTVHQGLDHVRKDSPIPWIHIAEEIAKLAAERGYRKVGVLGTKWLMEGPVYPAALAAKGIEREVPPSDVRQRVSDFIMNDMVRGRFEAGTRRYFQEAIKKFADDGCEAVVLGCTEIPLLIEQADSVLPVLDSTRTLARAALREATHNKSREAGVFT